MQQSRTLYRALGSLQRPEGLSHSRTEELVFWREGTTRTLSSVGAERSHPLKVRFWTPSRILRTWRLSDFVLRQSACGGVHHATDSLVNHPSAGDIWGGCICDILVSKMFSIV
ncbi:hypothetical protein TNCV_3934011 [Trichonephila clavipes]|nr:hypothetical protein TNCV_3934011 [Trichonephila clavipes]